ncbi:MAG: NUDIX domain-containing protein [Deinococcota bacterium]
MTLTRDFTVATFVWWRGQMLLHKHAKLGLWLPCGGHIEPNELPDDAAVRECLEETGVAIELVGERALEVNTPRQLIRPRGLQLEPISPGHEHIDLVYYGIPRAGYDGTVTGERNDFAWYTVDAWRELTLTEEVRAWLELAEREIPQYCSAVHV